MIEPYLLFAPALPGCVPLDYLKLKNLSFTSVCHFRSEASVSIERSGSDYEASYNYGDANDGDGDDVDDEEGDDRSSKNLRRFLPSEELGPVTARYVIVRRGMDVVLECHDAVGGEDVLWEKQGGQF